MPISGWTEDFEKLLRLPLKPIHVALHVGVWLGRSLHQHLQAFPKACAIGVDLFEPSDALTGDMFPPVDWYDVARKGLAYYGAEGAILLRGDSSEIATCFPDKTLDFVFIDGDHRYPGVCRDIRAWLPKVAPGGFLTGHDANYDGVSRAVHELLPTFTADGLIWWHKVPEVPADAAESR